jgi:hypothetical protein
MPSQSKPKTISEQIPHTIKPLKHTYTYAGHSLELENAREIEREYMKTAPNVKTIIMPKFARPPGKKEKVMVFVVYARKLNRWGK